MKNNQTTRGFTLIELTIAMAFLSILLIAILTLTLAAGKLYVKGLTNKNVNQSGREVQDIVRRDFLASNASSISPVYLAGSGTSVSGRICLGGVSYLWNTADILNDSTANGTTNRVVFSTSTPVHLARVVDVNATMCVKNMSSNYPTVIPAALASAELLGGDGRDFALYDLKIIPVVQQGDSGMYQFKYTVGTNDKGTVETEAAGNYTRCKPDASTTANFDYCAVNDFDMIVRVEGGIN